jgi:hypothetical protein
LSNHKKVIPFSSVWQPEIKPTLWTFFDFKDGQNNVIQTWYDGLQEEEQDVFESLLKINGKEPLPISWQGCKVLQGDAKSEKVWEWKFSCGRIQQRLLGVFGPNRREAIFLIGCNHKQKVYQPRDCITTAIKRAKLVKEGRVQLDGRTARSDQQTATKPEIKSIIH